MTVTVKGVQVDLTPVESSNVAGVGFIAKHSETCALMQPPKVEYIRGGARLLESPCAVPCSCVQIGTLIVQFKSGAAYTYQNVPKEVHAALMAAKSKGKYLQTHIVGCGAYPFERVTEPIRVATTRCEKCAASEAQHAFSNGGVTHYFCRECWAGGVAKDFFDGLKGKVFAPPDVNQVTEETTE